MQLPKLVLNVRTNAMTTNYISVIAPTNKTFFGVTVITAFQNRFVHFNRI